MDYVSFMLDLAGGGDHRVVPGTVAYRKHPRLPKTGFQWKVICDAKGEVIVIGMDDERLRVIATARWHGSIAERKQEDPGLPTPYQWELVETALRAELGTRGAIKDRSEEPPLSPRDVDESLEEIAETLGQKLGALRPKSAAAAPGGDYVSFLIDLVGEGRNRVIPHTVSYRRDPKVRPLNAFQWKVMCDANAKVLVAGFMGGKARVIASARWQDGLAEHRHREPTTPTSHQWSLVEVAIRDELARRAAMHDRSSEEPVPASDLIEDDAGLDAELEPAPVEALATPPARFAPRRYIPTPHERKRTAQRMAIVVGLSIAAAGAGLVLFFTTRNKAAEPISSAPHTQPPMRDPVSAPPPPPPVVIEPVEVRIAKAATFSDAIALAKPAMADTTEELGGGAKLFATYAASKLRWEDVDVAAETTLAHVLKDPEVERGKRLCVDGVIERIERRDLERRKIYVGSLRAADGDSIAFVAVGTTGELVKRTPARFCGAVIGKAGSAVSVVGMFDLPENRTPIVEQ